ncbi:MAG: MTAP family purine nucleoside phosphorylase [Candidatus Altiarchaeota archaeon]|nr:MTAP family purine nucleoside phosphorylase [Candidatus Altiarchaeota archaeon]
MVVGLIGGASMSNSRYMKGENRNMENKHGEVLVMRGADWVYVPRHGCNQSIPPHRINHKANIFALESEGVSHVVGVCSVGSLSREIKPGSLVVPDDYISLCDIPTYFNKDAIHITPVLDEDIRMLIVGKARELGLDVISGGTYFQTTGPRLETRAEVRLLRDYAEVVGMTLASEATLACELGIRYAALCTVDNYANGIADEQLDYAKVVKDASKDRDSLHELLDLVIEGLKCF